ncbi:MAG: SDR family oxidoreductase [Woeseiaceae bacterium]|nr:SDR family oxidoreductase [Woeseiaceae bacterium]
MTLSNKIVLVTGANRGIGKALVEGLLQKDVRKVYAAARKTSSLPDFGDTRVVPLELDITNEEQIRDAARAASDTDLLINNAGVLSAGSLITAQKADFEYDMNVNYYGTLDVIREFVPVLETKPDAGIVNVVTIAAFVSFPALGGYSASKSALWSASQGLRIELASKGISVQTVNPGPIDTDMARDIDMDKTSPEETAANILAGIEAGDADIFPDGASEGMFNAWSDDYRQLEKMVYDMTHAA